MPDRSRAQALDIRICCTGLWFLAQDISNLATSRTFYCRTTRCAAFLHSTKVAHIQVFTTSTLAHIARHTPLALEKYALFLQHGSRGYCILCAAQLPGSCAEPVALLCKPSLAGGVNWQHTSLAGHTLRISCTH